MGHADMIDLAVKWLLRPKSRGGPGCIVAIAEARNFVNGEVPDAIGWRPFDPHHGSVVVEVKASRSDFLADRKKPHRASNGMGSFRYFMAPAGMIGQDEIPDGWGLIEVDGRSIRPICGHVMNRRTADQNAVAANDAKWRLAHNDEAERAALILALAKLNRSK